MVAMVAAGKCGSCTLIYGQMVRHCNNERGYKPIGAKVQCPIQVYPFTDQSFDLLSHMSILQSRYIPLEHVRIYSTDVETFPSAHAAHTSLDW